MRPGGEVVIHYALANRLPDPRWRDQPGEALVVGRGPGPRNVLVRTAMGLVTVPYGNVRQSRVRGDSRVIMHMLRDERGECDTSLVMCAVVCVLALVIGLVFMK